MGTKKDIAKAFKEQLDHFKASPDDMVWQQLESDLRAKNKKKRILPFWLIFGSLGAVLIMMIILKKDALSNFLNDNQDNTVKIDSVYKSNETRVDLTSKETKSEDENNLNGKTTSMDENTHSNKPLDNTTISKEKTYNSLGENITHVSVNTSSDNNNNNLQTEKHKIKQKSNEINKSNQNFLVTTHEKIGKENEDSITNIANGNTALLRTDENHKNDTATEWIQDTEVLIDSLNIVDKKSIDKAVTDLDNKEQNTDSITNSQKSKWSVLPNVSLVYYDGFGKKFNNQLSISYGLYFTYLPFNKNSFRLGINKLNLKQTNTSSSNSNIEQEVSYLEIPFEIKINLVDRKIRTSAIAGFSYLILDDAFYSTFDNGIQLITNNKKDFSKSTLSFNVGLELQIKVFEKLYFNVEPMFKYHFEPYSINQDFNPFTISIIGGLEYKF